MRREQWIADQHSARPAGKPDECFYCHVKLGQPHRVGCVMRSRTVMVEVKVTLIMDIPEVWTTDLLEFHLNDGTSCADNLLDRMEQQAERMDCACHFVETKFLREATADDEEQYKMKVADAES